MVDRHQVTVHAVPVGTDDHGRGDDRIYVEDHCLKVDHARLLGQDPAGREHS